MNLTHLKYIVEVERQGSITKAAAALYMGQPNLSKVIKEMENELGVPIFKRTAKGVVPTAKGEEFLQYAKAVIVQIEKMEELYLSDSSERQSFQLMLPRASYITHAVTEFLKKLPHTERMDIKLKETNSLEAINAIIECEYSLAVIRYELHQEEFFNSLLAEKNLKSRRLLTFDSVVLVSEDSPLARKDRLTDSDLDDMIEILHGDTAVPNVSAALQKRSTRINTRKRHIYVYERGSQFDILCTVPDAFMFVSPMPQTVLDRCRLKQIPYSGESGAHRCRDALIYQSAYRMTATDKLFLDELEQVISEMPCAGAQP
ncbi:MAG: LysR family transcriptional regulator [Ruminococcus sp.]|nr:LysR family transcriptional regulator [Ruminococcus sp.]